jgi:hypothetical protein
MNPAELVPNPYYPATVEVAGPFDPEAAVWAPRDPDRTAKDSGQYGDRSCAILRISSTTPSLALYHV